MHVPRVLANDRATFTRFTVIDCLLFCLPFLSQRIRGCRFLTEKHISDLDLSRKFPVISGTYFSLGNGISLASVS